MYIFLNKKIQLVLNLVIIFLITCNVPNLIFRYNRIVIICFLLFLFILAINSIYLIVKICEE